MPAYAAPWELENRYPLRHPRLREAARLGDSGQLDPAARLLREHLKEYPGEPHALHLLGEIAKRQGRFDQMLALWAQCVEAAPDFAPARFDYAVVLLEAHRADTTLAHAEELLKREPHNADYRALKALALEALDDYSGAAELWRCLVVEDPENTASWTRYAFVLRGLGRLDECISAFRKVIAQDPASGGAWWNLADIKSFCFCQADIAEMEKLISDANVPASERICLHFALGKAYGDLKKYETSFGHYARGNALQRLSLPHDPDVLTSYVARAKRFFSPDFFRRHSGWGCASREPIFIVGMLRSGSTLVEQILASHSQIEATRELTEIAAISQHLQKFARENGSEYPAVLDRVGADAFRSFGERYLQIARIHRRLGRPCFIDKMGANFAHVALIQLLLPNARIVDVRRHPLACGFSAFSQYFSKGQNNTYRLNDIGRHYHDYVALMAHFDRVLPGRVHRIFYEDLVAQPETEVRRLLDYLELPFEESCLQFHRTERAIATVSAEQVRQPIYRKALEHWRNYEPWLGPLKAALGPVFEFYPAVPEFGEAAECSSGGGGAG
ncbi:MAG TPA: sulfotransferase [Rhizomicrobium sp.]|jgi:tetratricopeptide (TPR) repeat protein|nr:sulfotransferase [Rhizomicrobium sp.]